MPLQYKIDVLAALKEKGYNTNKIRTEGLLSQSEISKGFRGKTLKCSALCWIASRGT